MNILPDKDQNNLALTEPSLAEKAAVTATTPATSPENSPGPPKPKRRWLAVLVVSLLLIAAVTGWLVFMLNRPPIEIKALPPGPPTAQATSPVQVTGSSGSPAAASSHPPVTTTPPAAKIQGYGVVISRVLNMRSAPNTDASVLKSLKSGDIVELANRNGGWYQTGDGLWISAAYLEVRQTRPEAESYARELAST